VVATTDTDNDGLSAFEEMVFAGNPHEQDVSVRFAQSQVVNDADTLKLELTFQRPLNYQALGVVYRFQENQDLQGAWVESPVVASIVVDGEIERVTYMVPVTFAHHFYRWDISVE